MPISPSSLEEEGRLEEVLAAYLRAAESGEAPPPQDVMAAYPELSSELEQFFSGRDAFERALEPVRAVFRASDRHPTPHPADTLNEPPHRVLAGPRIKAAADDYEIIERIGRGGMGVVYKARQRRLNRLVALKMIRATRLASKDDIHRSRNEAESVATLEHPNIVPVYDVGELGGQLYFSMKLVEGGTLVDRKKRIERDGSDKKGPNELKAIVRMVTEICHAIQHAHERGILHRDLKPSNILLDADGRPFVTDFGLAKRLDTDHDLTQTGEYVGTPAYMAPEMIAPERRKGNSKDSNSDGRRFDPAASPANARPGLPDPAAHPGCSIGRETC